MSGHKRRGADGNRRGEDRREDRTHRRNISGPTRRSRGGGSGRRRRLEDTSGQARRSGRGQQDWTDNGRRTASHGPAKRCESPWTWMEARVPPRIHSWRGDERGRRRQPEDANGQTRRSGGRHQDWTDNGQRIKWHTRDKKRQQEDANGQPRRSEQCHRDWTDNGQRTVCHKHTMCHTLPQKRAGARVSQ